MSASTGAVVLAVFLIAVLVIAAAVLALPALVVAVAGAVLALFAGASLVGRLLARLSSRYPVAPHQPAPGTSPEE